MTKSMKYTNCCLIIETLMFATKGDMRCHAQLLYFISCENLVVLVYNAVSCPRLCGPLCNPLSNPRLMLQCLSCHTVTRLSSSVPQHLAS